MRTDGTPFCFFPVTQTIRQVNTAQKHIQYRGYMQTLQDTNEIVGCTKGSNIGVGGFCQQKSKHKRNEDTRTPNDKSKTKTGTNSKQKGLFWTLLESP